MIVLATRNRRYADECQAILLAEGIDSLWQRGPVPRALYLDVAVSDSERVATLLSEHHAEEGLRKKPLPFKWTPLLLQPAFAFALGMAALTLVVHWVTASDPHWFNAGALFRERALAGEWWRIITAATLHADAEHALGNATFFLVLAWAAAERVGAGMAALTWLLTAIFGFVISLAFGDAGITIGASGGLFGLLGLAGGHGMKLRRRGISPRRQRLRNFGAAVMLLAFTAFSARSNIHAHVGGFVGGVFLGLGFPARPLPTWAQALAAAITLAAVGLAWGPVAP